MNAVYGAYEDISTCDCCKLGDDEQGKLCDDCDCCKDCCKCAKKAPDRTRAERAKFQVEFMLMMLSCGRTDEAQDAVVELMEILDEMIKEGQ